VSNFKTVNVVDFEYEIEDGDLPDVLCMVCYVLDENLRHVDTIRLWRGEFGNEAPFDIGRDALFVAYSAWAELTCFLVLGWPFPEHVFDLHTAYLAQTNILLPYNPDEVRKRQSKRLPDACRSFGIEGWERIEKDVIAKDIGEGRWRLHGQSAVYKYCEEDVKMSAALLRRQLRGRGNWLPPADVSLILHWSNYSSKAVAQIQARGMPIDLPLWNLVQENKLAVIDALRQQFDPSYTDDESIYTPDGAWSYERFEWWLIQSGIRYWPRLDSGRLNIDGDTFRSMYHVPGIEGLHALRDSIGVIARAKLPIGRDGRNRPSLFPFCTTSGRNAHSKSLYNAHAGMRSFMVFPPNKIGVYLDWRSQEVGVAAARSQDRKLITDYLGGDVYHGLAQICNPNVDPDPKRWKANNYAERNRMKPLELGIRYGMGVPSLARSLNCHPLISGEIIKKHQATYPDFWKWRENEVQVAMLTRRMESADGWPLRLSTSPNVRTLYNFPMQSDGAAMLRDTAVKLCASGMVPCMLIHDGVLLEVESREQVEHAKEIMRESGRLICDGLDIGADVDQLLEGGARYRDKRPVAKKMWGTVMGALRSVGAISEEDAA
jgi:DNA polymerase I